jgi:CO/xanthine dehydrogenase Mo-binding subunit
MYETIPSSDLKTVGRGERRIDGVEKVAGSALYIADMVMPGMLYAKVKHSPHPRARIVRIDTSKAQSLPGVHGVLTGNELTYRVGLYLVDKFVLARDMVRYEGEAIAAVAAESPEIAAFAVDLIDVEYEVLPPVTNPVEALGKDSPLVHPDLGTYSYVEAVFTPMPDTNIANHTKLRKGDIDKGFAEADLIVERRYTNPNVQHVPLETHGSIGKWEAGDRLTVWTSAQSPFTVRNLLCYSFGLPHNAVRVITPYIGGGFGGKAGIHLEPLVLCLSRKAGGASYTI